MCGIAGGFSLRGPLDPVDAEIVSRLNYHQRRRGPDGEGLWTSPDGAVTLGQRRLAVIAVCDAGAQPMADATGRWVITFNGEIYNYRELRRELESAGRRFVTNTDTEVLINCIAEWGEAGLAKLRGMYAFGLWDNANKELWLARDPFGIKPLYWAHSGSRLWFASQARTLAGSVPVNTARDPAALVGFYLWGSVPEPFTWWEGVSAVPAGHLLRIAQGGTAPAPKAFTKIEHAYKAAVAGPLSHNEFREALVDSIKAHFVADVPVGVFLSAGIDSTVIATLAKEAGYRLRTVTLAFDEFRGTDFDEAPLAEETARLLGADHTTVRIGRDEFVALIDELMTAMDQPTTDGLNTFLVSRAAASVGLKVALSGLGGDELFGGYPSFSQVPRLVALGRKTPGRVTLGNLLHSVGFPIAQMLHTSPKYSAALKYSHSFESAYFLRRCLHLTEELELLLDESWRRPGIERLASLEPNRALLTGGSANGLSPHATVSSLEIQRYMRNQPLRDTDWASMAHSVEVRVPFLDLPFFSKVAVAIASNKPPSKVDLAICTGSIGGRLLARPKTGFVTPVANWLEHSGRVKKGLRSWADVVATAFRTGAHPSILRTNAAGAA